MRDIVDPTTTIAITKFPESTPKWTREWLIAFLRNDREDGHGMSPPWSMSHEDIMAVLACFERSGASADEAEHMTLFLPEAFCRKCLDLGGVHLAASTQEDAARGRRLWIAGPPPDVGSSPKGFIGPLQIDYRAENVELYLREHPIGTVLTLSFDGVDIGQHEVVLYAKECPALQFFKVPKGARSVTVDGDRVMFSTV